MRKLYAAGIEPIGIARYQPRWFSGRNMKHLAPTSYMLSDKCSSEEYLRLYDDLLNNLNLDELRKQFEIIGHDIALCCYEKPTDFCHRHLLADYLNKNGFDVQEFGVEPKREEED